MEQPLQIMFSENKEKFTKTVKLLKSSMDNSLPFDPSRNYSSKELEPYDALAIRFERAVEMAIKLFKNIELSEFGPLDNSLRDSLNNMHKLDLISNVSLWMDMRSLRNRVAHDYQEVMLDKVYQAVSTKYFEELENTKNKITQKYMHNLTK